MKRFILLLFGFGLLLPFSSQATHIAGTDLQYRYIGDSTGIPHHYELIFRFYRDVTGIGAPNTINISVQSSCFANTNVTLPFDPLVLQGQVAPTLFDCVDQQPGVVVSQLYVYRNTVILNGVCSDWRFSYTCGACRNPSTNSPPNQTYFIVVELNNTLGPNTSPVFVSEPVRAFCTGRSFNWTQNVFEPDGDSLFYNLIQPLVNANNPINWTAPYTHLQPFPTAPPQSLVVNNATGVFSFTLAATGTFVCAIGVDEYRFDSINSGWVKIGTSVRDMQITVAGICSPEAERGVYIDTTGAGYLDPATGLFTVDYSCDDSLIMMSFGIDVDCFSIAPDGTDFRLTDPNGVPVPIRGLIPNCDFDNATNTIGVDLHEPLRVNGIYYLYSKIGTDGNTLLNKCGFPMDEFDTIAINVSGCYDPMYNIENVTIVENDYPMVEFAADTASFPIQDFDAWEIYRSDDNGATFNIVGAVNTLMDWQFEDLSGIPSVGTDTYRYRIRLVLGNRRFQNTRNITSILLESDNNGQDTNFHNLTWNAYDGWGSPQYHVMIGLSDGAGGFTFQQHQQGGNPTNQRNFAFEGPQEQGQYAIRVDAHDPNSGQYIASSNWVIYGVLETLPPPPPPTEAVEVPNVITPNGDGINDNFIVRNIETYANNTVTIFTRWGQKVYETSGYDNNMPWDGRDMQGNQLADGVYFYIITLDNPATFESEEKKGTVTISRGGN
ncbi:MAG: gliding motility-associated C-terminal domain-containing protein [Schleiferiaceae bacterium]|nr:gliding motility-associated C-terminal domain-containing protein [Schleiferiaceae bacterium]